MTRLARIAPRFVEAIPKALEDGVFYISETYGTASHKCACGCGMRVVTPLTPTDWRVVLEADGTISLAPSIGNWDYPCQSHYWIRHNRIDWAVRWTRSQIEAGRAYDRAQKAAYFSERSREKHDRFTAVVRWIRNLFR
jgi:hypothetical protein